MKRHFFWKVTMSVINQWWWYFLTNTHIIFFAYMESLAKNNFWSNVLIWWPLIAQGGKHSKFHRYVLLGLSKRIENCKLLRNRKHHVTPFEKRVDVMCWVSWNGVGGLEGVFELRVVSTPCCIYSTFQIQIVARYLRNEIQTWCSKQSVRWHNCAIFLRICTIFFTFERETGKISTFCDFGTIWQNSSKFKICYGI